MTLVRTFVAAVALAACAAPGQIHSTTTAPTSTYRLCSDPQFEAMCTPASLEKPAAPVPILIDTNLKSTVGKRTTVLG